MSRELITLQFGHSSNYIGTHFWNIQESGFNCEGGDEVDDQSSNQVDHDVLFREGRNVFRQVTYTPRLLLFDLKGSLKTLPENGGYLYAEEEGEVVWSSDVTLHKAQPSVKNEFLRECETDMDVHDFGSVDEEKENDENDSPSDAAIPGASAIDLGKEVDVWSDFLGTQLHPRSLNIVKDYCHGACSDTDTAFDLFVQGWNLLGPGSSKLREEFEEERIRYFVEECDYLQGFQLLCDAHDGFGGMASGASEYLQDEFHGRSLLALPLCPLPFIYNGDSSKVRNRRIFNLVMSLASLGENASAVCPLSLRKYPWAEDTDIASFSWLHFDPLQQYQSSSIFASAIDTLTLGCRMKTPSHTFSLYCSLANCGQKFLALETSFPFPLSPGLEGSLFHVLQNHTPSELFTSLNPLVSGMSDLVTKTNAVYVSLRGVSEKRCVGLSERKKHNLSNNLTSCNDFFRSFMGEHFGGPFQFFSTSNRQQLRRPFPRIFSDELTTFGDVLNSGNRLKTSTSKGNLTLPSSVAAATSLRATEEIGQGLNELRKVVEKLPLSLCLPTAATDVFEVDDVKSLLENFYQLCDSYGH